jgi:fructokinase
LNIHELQALQDSSTELKATMEKCLSQHNLEGIIVTCGEKGALALDATGEFFSVSPNTSVDIIDTVGAGDAFTAIFLLGLNLEWNLAEIMERAQLFASAITMQQGATVNDPNFYEPFIKSWDL